jgi:hypothetical protein
MSDNKDNPLYIDQDALIAGVASLGEWLDKHGPLAAWENTMDDNRMTGETRGVITRAEELWDAVYKQLPWEVEPPYGDRRPWWEVRDGLGSPFVELWDEPLANLIAELPVLLPALLAEVKRLRSIPAPDGYGWVIREDADGNEVSRELKPLDPPTA